MTETILNYLILFIITGLAAIITTVLLPKLNQWLKSKTENEKLQSVISDITTTVRTTVDELEQTMVSKYKEQGKWDVEAQKQVLSEAVQKVISGLLNSTKETLEENGVDVLNLIIRYIEAYIKKEKEL